jgi:hypothetical protein
MMEVPVGIAEEFYVHKRSSKFLVGLAGKQRSGKTTMAWVIAGHYGAAVAPFAAAIKGGASYIYSSMAFRPQWVGEVRRRLQDCGMAGRSLTDEADLWIRCWRANFGDLPRCVIPDVRFSNEVDFVRSSGGKVIYLNYVGAPSDPHPSEQLSPHLCDYCVEVTDDNRRWVLSQILLYLKEHFGEPASRPKVYVGTNIHGERVFEKAFLALSDIGMDYGFDPLIPVDATDRRRWAQMVSEMPFSVASRELVVGDISLVSQAHAAFFWLEKPSIGIAMEILCAALNERPVVVVTPHLELFYHPWLQAFAKVIWSERPEDGWAYLQSVFFPETI